MQRRKPNEPNMKASTTLGILSLGGHDPDPQRLKRARAYFEGQDWRVRVAPAPEARFQRFAATDEARLAALADLVNDPDVSLIMALRGGYGASRLLARIDYASVAHAVQTRGLRIVGHSDFTAFHLALLARTGAVSHAGPMAGYDFGSEDGPSAFTLAHFVAMLNGEADHVEFSVGAAFAAFGESGPDLDVSGTLWGGNLAMVCSLIGTPWMPQVEDGLLFLEDVSEHPYRIERMLLQLHHAGILARQRAILLGDFSGYQLSEHDGGYDLNAVVDYLRTVSPVPIITGLPFGHCRDKLTLPVGGSASLQVVSGIASLRW